MGLDLKPLLSAVPIKLAELSGKTVAVDAYNTIYQFLATIRGPTGEPLANSRGEITSHLSGLFYRNTNLLMENIRPIYVYDGKAHSVDSKEIAFATAGRKAFCDAVTKASPIVLEPIVKLQINAPEYALGDITGDLSSKRGQVNGTSGAASQGGGITVNGQVPLSELNAYQARLNGLTAGQGRFSLELSHYEPVPPQVQQRLVAQYKVKDEE